MALTFAPLPVSPERMSSGTSILLVDDDRLWLDALKRVLEREGFRVSTVTSANGAVRAIRETPVDVIVSDICMPRMDGLELRDALLGDSARAPIPFIFVSGAYDASTREMAAKLGVSHLLEKTAPVSELAHLARMLSARHAAA